ncbi:MAG: CHAT domain-containing tetratricopeptide repeat protein [Cyanobacteriota bacterium]
MPVDAADRQFSPQVSRDLILSAQASGRSQLVIPAQILRWLQDALDAYIDGDINRALTLQRQVVDWAEANLPRVHPFRAKALSTLGELLSASGDIQQAFAVSNEALKIHRELVRSNPTEAVQRDFVIILNNSSIRYSQQGNPRQALLLTEEALQVVRGLAHANKSAYQAELARTLTLLGVRYTELGDNEKALYNTKEAVAVAREQAVSNSSSRYMLASALLNLGPCYNDLGLTKEALASTEEAVGILREIVNSNPSAKGELALALNNLGNSYNDLGRRQEALEAADEAVTISRQFSQMHGGSLDSLAGALHNLSYRYSQLGRHKEAVAPAEESVGIVRQLADRRPRAYKGILANSLSSLGSSYLASNLPREGFAMVQESVTILRQLVKAEPQIYLDDLAGVLTNSGVFYGSLGRPNDGLAPSIEAVQIFRTLAKKNPAYTDNLADSLNNLGVRYRELRLIEKALLPAKEAVNIRRELGATNSAYLEPLAKSLANLANLQLQLQNKSSAQSLLREMVGAEVRFLHREVPLVPEERRFELVQGILGKRWQIPFSLAQDGHGGASLAIFTRLNRHAPLQDIERRQGIAARASGPAKDVLVRLQALTAQMANPLLPSDRRMQAETDSEKLQRELVRLLPEFETRLVEPTEVAKRLPADGVLVEFQRFSPYDSSKPEGKEWGDLRYLAMLLDSSGQVRAVDLGLAENIELNIAVALQHTRAGEPKARESWLRVENALFGPIKNIIAGSRRLLIAPDGELHRVPFSSLGTLADHNALSAGMLLQTIGSGRDLLPIPGRKPDASASLVLADPTSKGWPELPAASEEGIAVAASLQVPLLQGSAAKVGALEQARSPHLIHLAAHGYFDDRAVGDPLLASGIVLAGADKDRLPNRNVNAVPPDSSPLDDGYLTAKEAARLQLDGTSLVVLSACDTGLGQQRTGEGVFGLQRSLTVAGARGTLLSLWKVDDRASKVFMENFYALLKQGLSPERALRQVQEKFLRQPEVGGWSAPRYWAAWQYSGVPSEGMP